MANDSSVKIKVHTNGPLVVEGPVTLTLADGTVEEKSKLFLCRCGATSNRPYCDGSHVRIEFKD